MLAGSHLAAVEPHDSACYVACGQATGSQNLASAEIDERQLEVACIGPIGSSRCAVDFYCVVGLGVDGTVGWGHLKRLRLAVPHQQQNGQIAQHAPMIIVQKCELMPGMQHHWQPRPEGLKPGLQRRHFGIVASKSTQLGGTGTHLPPTKAELAIHWTHLDPSAI